MSGEHTAPAAPGAPPALAVVSRRIAPVEDLHGVLPAADAVDAVSWVRRGEGMVGVGRAWSARTRGADRMAEADARWRALTAASSVDDPVAVPGSGLVAFGSFAFHDASPAGGALVVPTVVVGRRGDRSWITVARAVPAGTAAREVLGALRTEIEEALTATAGRPPTLADLAHLTGLDGRPTPPRAPHVHSERPGGLDEAGFHEAVHRAVERIEAGDVAKVVLSRSVVARTEEPLDVRALLGRLAASYPSTWTFAVDGLVGATPELLVRRDRGLAAARVLAGTVPLETTGTPSDGEHPESAALRVAEALAESSKDLAEHEFAVESLVRALAPYCASMNVPDQPFVLRLPNVMHLASDVTGAVRTVDGIAPSSLVLAEALHPTAAVGGTPTEEAVALIAATEGEDRGRYAGPVGWLGADGDGEWGIALRCGAIEAPDAIRLHAGCGIVPGSDPGTEFAESQAKLAPMRAALS